MECGRRGGGSRGLSSALPRESTDPGVDKSDPRCSERLPDGSTVSENVQTLLARAMAAAISPQSSDAAVFQTYGYWLSMVREGGHWDYKRQPGGSEEIGNFNYGATGSIMFNAGTLLRAAGAVQLVTLPSASDGGSPIGGPPYGDQVRDQNDILAGIGGGCH